MEVMDPSVRTAVGASHLCGLPEEILGALIADSTPVRVPGGTVTHHEGDVHRHLDLVVAGLLRISVSAPDGRTLTVRYCRRGALVGVVSLFRDPFVMPATVRAAGDAEVLRLSVPVASRLAATDVRVTRVMALELAERVDGFVREIPGSAFATVRHRLTRHLLDLSTADGADGTGAPVVRASQSELADAVGTVREVVVRELRALRSDGLVATGRDHITLLDPARLLEEQDRRGWNPSS